MSSNKAYRFSKSYHQSFTENLNATIRLTATPYLQTFVSHDTYGTTNYPDGNFARDWLITGQIHNYTITIEFMACVLETGNNKGACIDDNVFIYDGAGQTKVNLGKVYFILEEQTRPKLALHHVKLIMDQTKVNFYKNKSCLTIDSRPVKNANVTLIKKTCCGMGDAVPFQVYSTNGYMYIIFQTDDNVGSTGFRISYILEGAPTTTAHVTTSTNLDPVDGKLPVYITVGCVAAVMMIISVVCCITWKQFCNNKMKIKGCDNDAKKHNS
ncbi:Hypothetical predicted protein [Mytilus galloprovincialis]|uniref:CUB domain-containing protein n=1 Tax=Mytilus galloprovincialis TaxID=29158 RepID=A0A8B6D8X6_MYTGA|nr:Hypothetical predicted protein [Mytilus galloprovincialis]